MEHKRKDMALEDVIVNIRIKEKNRSHQKAAKAMEFTSKANLIAERHDKPHGNHNRQNNIFGCGPTLRQGPKSSHLKPQSSNTKNKGSKSFFGNWVKVLVANNVVIKDMTVLAPLYAPNTDGIDADSSINVCIEDCYIESGDALVPIKSGWDQYGITMGRPSSNIIIRRVSDTTPTCSGVGIGSEMSGGISNVIVEDLHVRDSAAGIRIKTDKGRGGYIANITACNITMERVKVPIRFSRGANDHPDEGWDPNAVPKGHFYQSNVVNLNSTKAPLLEGIKDAPFEGRCMNNVSILGLAPSVKWNCEYVSGAAHGVFPSSCPQFQSNGSSSSSAQPYYCSLPNS
ncbi:LOW QUALITY PROTEIN: hypothetical protein RJ639_006773 [Escallonia herrerae]|uniref:Polygalacturonase n=1 Tax=Escallonia herrerae TaxID=1293975 RepID=A0AA88W0D3_9ASTE|nr:LOW QUALITY PROTEIN: hypothetical protein RJ639_006773 [Escallonia herrerae]